MNLFITIYLLGYLIAMMCYIWFVDLDEYSNDDLLCDTVLMFFWPLSLFMWAHEYKQNKISHEKEITNRCEKDVDENI